MKLIYIDENKLPENPYNDDTVNHLHRKIAFSEGQQYILSQPDLMQYMDEICNGYIRTLIDTTQPYDPNKKFKTFEEHLQECIEALKTIEELKK